MMNRLLDKFELLDEILTMSIRMIEHRRATAISGSLRTFPTFFLIADSRVMRRVKALQGTIPVQSMDISSIYIISITKPKSVDVMSQYREYYYVKNREIR